MADVATDSIIASVPFLYPELRQAVPLVLAACGGVVSERAGVINIALEGCMLTGAFVGLVAGQSFGLAAGLLGAIAAGGLVGLIHLLLTHRLGVNQIVSGVAINLLALHVTTFLMRIVFVRAEPPREAKLAALIPIDLFFVACFAVPLLLQLGLSRTPLGLRLRAVGESPESARMAGIGVLSVRTLAVVASGMLAGAGGAYLSMSQVGRFSDDMVAGRGYIALAAVIAGRWMPVGAAAAALVFGLLDSVQLQMQGTAGLPPEILRMTPYLVAIVAAFALRSKPPAALGAPIEPSRS